MVQNDDTFAQDEHVIERKGENVVEHNIMTNKWKLE